MRSRSMMLLIATLAASSALAQSSNGYTLEEHIFNAGGRPDQGVVASSTSYRITLDSVGDGLIGFGVAGSSYRFDVGFIAPYRPPGEVSGVLWTNDSQFLWSAEPSAGTYNVYRDPLNSLPGTHGHCLAQSLTTTNHTDPDIPSTGIAYYYLVTVENLLAEEGTRGMQSNGTPRSALNACP